MSGRVTGYGEGGPRRHWRFALLMHRGPEILGNRRRNMWRRDHHCCLGPKYSGRPCPFWKPGLPGQPATEKKGSEELTWAR